MLDADSIYSNIINEEELKVVDKILTLIYINLLKYFSLNSILFILDTIIKFNIF